MLWKRTIVSLILFGASLAAALLAASTGGPQVGPAFTVPAFEVDQVTSLTVTGGENPVTLKKEDGTWWVMPDRFPADEGAVKSALEKAKNLRVGPMRSANPERQKEMGVSDEDFRVTLAGDAGTIFEFHVGKETADKKGDFIRKAGEKGVYVTVGRVKSVFDKKLKLWRMRRFAGVEKDKVRSLVIEGAQGKLSFVKEGDTWKFAEPPAGLPPDFRLDPREVDSAVSTVTGLYAQEFADPAKKPAEVGLEPARITITLKEEAGREAVVLLGNKEDKKVYARRADQPWIYQVAESGVERFDKGLEGFRDLTVAGFDADQAREFAVRGPHGTTRFTRPDKDSPWTLAETSETVPDDFHLDAEKVDSIVASAARFRGKVFVGATNPADFGLDKPAAEVTVTLSDGAKRTLRFGKESGEKEKLVAVMGDDGMIYQAAKYSADRLTAPLADYKVAAAPKQPPMMTPEMLKNLPPEVAQQFLQKQRQEILQRQLMKQFMKQQKQGEKPKEAAPAGP